MDNKKNIKRNLTREELAEEIVKCPDGDLLRHIRNLIAEKAYTCSEDSFRPEMVNAFCKIYALIMAEKLQKIIIGWVFLTIIFRKFLVNFVIFIQKRFRR